MQWLHQVIRPHSRRRRTKSRTRRATWGCKRKAFLSSMTLQVNLLLSCSQRHSLQSENLLNSYCLLFLHAQMCVTEWQRACCLVMAASKALTKKWRTGQRLNQSASSKKSVGSRSQEDSVSRKESTTDDEDGSGAWGCVEDCNLYLVTVSLG